MPKRIILGHIVSRLINTQIINRFRVLDNIIRQYIIITIIGWSNVAESNIIFIAKKKIHITNWIIPTYCVNAEIKKKHNFILFGTCYKTSARVCFICPALTHTYIFIIHIQGNSLGKLLLSFTLIIHLFK